MSEQGIEPIPDDSSAPYWEGIRRGKLLLQRCKACGTIQFYPRSMCSECLAPDPTWVESKGRGVIHTFSTIHRTSDERFSHLVPYILAIVELDEGPRMMAHILTKSEEHIRCDDAVQVFFEKTGNHTLPQFVPLQEQAR
jgi:uncharacterized OB-fold protein